MVKDSNVLPGSRKERPLKGDVSRMCLAQEGLLKRSREENQTHLEGGEARKQHRCRVLSLVLLGWMASENSEPQKGEHSRSRLAHRRGSWVGTNTVVYSG